MSCAMFSCGAAIALLTLQASSSTAQGPAAARTIFELLELYQSGEYSAAVERLSVEIDAKTFQTTFTDTAARWINSERSSEVVTRRLVTAAFALEAAHARLSSDNASMIVLLDWAVKELRRTPPTAAERAWTLAAVALVERGGRPAFSFALVKAGGSRWGEGFISNAIRRFPDEPRLRMARAVWQVSHGIRRSGQRDLERLATDPQVGADALLQLAYLQLSERRYGNALRDAGRAAELALDPSAQYLAHFILAFCHEAERRPSQAAAEYAAALRAVPNAQSASLGLALLLMRNNEAEQAFDLVDRSLAERPDGEDPWRLFAYGGYVRWPILIAELRKVVQ